MPHLMVTGKKEKAVPKLLRKGVVVQKSFNLLGIYQVCGNVVGSLYTSAYLIVTNVMRQALPSRAQRRKQTWKVSGTQSQPPRFGFSGGSGMEPRQVSLTSQAMPRFAQCWGCPQEGSPDGLCTGRALGDSPHQHWEIRSSRGASAVFFKGALGGRWSLPLLGRLQHLLVFC